jgi:hypothetical protein
MLCAQRSSPWAFSLDTLSFELGYGPTRCGVKARQMAPARWHRRHSGMFMAVLVAPVRRPAPMFIAAFSNSSQCSEIELDNQAGHIR